MSQAVYIFNVNFLITLFHLGTRVFPLKNIGTVCKVLIATFKTFHLIKILHMIGSIPSSTSEIFLIVTVNIAYCSYSTLVFHYSPPPYNYKTILPYIPRYVKHPEFNLGVLLCEVYYQVTPCIPAFKFNG